MSTISAASVCAQEPATTSSNQVQDLVAKARIAQAVFESFSQEQVDAIVKGIGKYVYDNAEMLARMAVDETGIGVYEDKILKNKGKARVIWNSLKDKKSRGIIGEDADTNMVFVAKPMGVVGAVTPVTNPIVTPMCNAMFALKTGNAVIFAPHPKAEQCTVLLDRGLHECRQEPWRPGQSGPDDQERIDRDDAGTDEGGRRGGRDRRRRHGEVRLLLGPAVVRRRCGQRSGDHRSRCRTSRKPPRKSSRARRSTTASSARTSSSCSRRKSSTRTRSDAFEATGKVWFTDDEAQVQRLRDVVFPGGRLNKDVVGRSASEIGRMAGLDVPASARIILLPAKGAGTADVLAKEKLCPVVAILPYTTFTEAVAHAKANLLVEGAGHSAAVHSNDEAHIREAGVELPVSRLVVNQPSALTAGGSLTNGFAATTTLGCGSWGGNSISENLDYKHLMNVSRIGKMIANKKVPTDAEIWA